MLCELHSADYVPVDRKQKKQQREQSKYSADIANRQCDSRRELLKTIIKIPLHT